MRLLLDVSAVPARPVGAGVYTVELVRELATRDTVDLHLVTRHADTDRWSELAPKAALHAEVPDRRPARLVWEQTGAPRLANRVGADLWHGPHYTLPLRPTIPTVVTVHDLTFFEHPEWHERSKVAFFRRMTRASVRRAAAVVTVSEHTRARLSAALAPESPVVVAAHGVDHARFSPADDDDLARLRAIGIRPPYIAFAATLEPRKDVPGLIDAFAHIAPAHPDLTLVIAGRDGWGAVAIRGRGRAQRLHHAHRGIGWMDDAVLPAFFRQSEIVAYPSLEEGFGLPALEALACGAALVTTTGSAMEEVVGDAALLVRPRDPEALGRALDRVLNDPTMAARLRAAGPPRARDFTWARSVDQHLAAYTAALGDNEQT